MHKLGFSLMRVVMLVMLMGCNVQPPQFTCPTPPPPADWGPVANMNGQSSVDIELSRPYVIERIRKMLESPASAAEGVFVQSIDLKELPGPNNRALSVLEIRLEPWLQGQAGQPVSLQRAYRLTLKITPHVTASQGALLTFDLLELYNVSFSRVACDSPDSIDSHVVPGIYKKLAEQLPLTLPTESVSAVLASASGSMPQLVDVNVSADGFLKIGLQYNVGGTHPFDRATMLLSRYPERDWVVDIDPSILAASVSARMLAALTASAPGSTLTSFSATFAPGEIQANGVAAVPLAGICGSSTTVTIAARNPTQICKDATGSSVIVSWTDATDTTGNFCINFKKFWDNIGVGTISGPPVVWPTLATVSFPAGDNDNFYGTDLDLDNAFAIVGRSSIMDSQAATNGQPRPDMPGKCPGVP